MRLADAIRLGRVSNLPTILTNVAAGIVLAGGEIADRRTLPLMLAMALAYVGGMYLNDAFDAEIDRRERPHRPIPSGRVGLRTVFAAGFAMLAASLLLLAWVGSGPDGTGPWPVVAGAILAATIVVYDRHHKKNPLSPVLMGLCRALVYVVAGLAFAAGLAAPVVAGAALLLGHILGLTYLAKQESLGRVANLWPLLFLAAPLVYGIWLALAEPFVWFFVVALAAVIATAFALAVRRRPGDIGKAVVLLIAGICLFDALMIAGEGNDGLALLAMFGFFVTLFLQRIVPGT